jgi:chromosomal replication initiator protein
VDDKFIAARSGPTFTSNKPCDFASKTGGFNPENSRGDGYRREPKFARIRVSILAVFGTDRGASFILVLTPVFASDGAAVESDVFTISFKSAGAALSPLRSESSLGEFIAGAENRLAKVAVESLLATPTEYTPVLFCGPSGTGKSHLANGVAEANQRAVSTSGADFARDLAAAIDRGDQASFRKRFRSAEMFVLDGLTQLAERRAALCELQQTLDELEAREATVVMTSRVPVDEIKGLPPALRSRLSGGLTVHLAPPSVAVRQAILQRLAASRGIAISPAAIESLAKSSKLTVSECRGALLELEMTSQASQPREIDLEQVRRYLSSKRNRHWLGPKRVTTLVAKFYGLKSAALVGPSRRRQVVLARSVAMYLCRSVGGMSLEALGRHFGGRDHTTALHSCRSVENRLQHDFELRGAVETLQRSLGE